MLRRHARTRGEKHLPLGNARCGRARTLNGPGWRLRCRVCRTSDRRGSPVPHDRSAAPSGSQRHTPRPASGSSAPDRSTGDPWTNNELQVHCEARKDREQHRSSAPDDLRGPRRRDETRRTVDLGHSSDGPSWIDLAAIRVNTTESSFAASLNRLLQQNLPDADLCRVYSRPGVQASIFAGQQRVQLIGKICIKLSPKNVLDEDLVVTSVFFVPVPPGHPVVDRPLRRLARGWRAADLARYHLRALPFVLAE